MNTQMQLDAIKINVARRKTASHTIGGDAVASVPFTPIEDELILALKKRRVKNHEIAAILGASVNAVRSRMAALKKAPAD